MNEPEFPTDDTALPEELQAAYYDQRYDGDLADVVRMAQAEPAARGEVGSAARRKAVVWWSVGLTAVALAAVLLGWWFGGSNEVASGDDPPRTPEEVRSEKPTNAEQSDTPPDAKVEDVSPSPTPPSAKPPKRKFRPRLTVTRPPAAARSIATTQPKKPRMALSSGRPTQTSFLSLPKQRRGAQSRSSTLFFQARFQPLKPQRSKPNAT